MSSSTPGQTSTPSSDFKSIIDAALSEYKKKTGKELLDHPLATEVQRCDSVDAILAIFQGQAEAFQQFRAGDQRLMKWISPVVGVLYKLSETLGGVAGTAFPPVGIIFTGIGILLAAAKDVRASHDAFVELFERIENFFKRLGVYTQISLTTEMAEVLVKIVSEVLCILSIATKEVKRTRARIYFGKLLGRTDIEDALKRLESLIQEEVRMAIAQTMNNMDEIKWNQIEQDVRKWFSPPDPSANHNTACDVYHKEPPTWFFRAGTFRDWMSNGSLLWVHGKPGSGKSVVCSAIIQHIMTLRDAGKAVLAYFYFDFRDEEKQNVRNLVTSLLIQLSAYSKPCCDIIYRLYLAHGKGAQQPSNGILMGCLKAMLTVAAQHPIFIIVDALDECPDYGMPTPREAVLSLVKDLVYMRLPNLHICATSRPEVDIQTILKPLAIHAISLHDEHRQKIVIANYVSSVVSSDEHMMKWRDEDKKLVVDELSERADGMFQWVFCQLETLRHAVQPDVRGTLEALPRNLDETYERMLKNINAKNRNHARRLLHCLAVAVRPLRVEELAEILAFDFDGAQGGIPKFHAERRPNDQEEAVLSTCSSLIAVVDNRDSRVVQFSHLSVKEFLTSTHLASSTRDLSVYHVLPGPAHTILAQVCLGILLLLDGRNYGKSVMVSPLAEYAARHWVTHAQFEDVASRVVDGMKPLFDPDKPHFTAWIGLFDIDAESGGRSPSETPSPLYYSALCGFHDLVQHLAIKYPQHVNATGGSYGFPLFAALCKNHFRVAELLLRHGGRIDVRDTRGQTALHKTINQHDKEAIGVMQFLLERGADANARRDDLWTPLHLAVNLGKLSVARMLLDHRADANSRNGDGQTPLHLLSKCETFQAEDDGCDLAKLLLERGANANERDKNNATPLQLASQHKKAKMVRVLVDHGAKETGVGETGMSRESQEDGVRPVQPPLDRGVNANVQHQDDWTPLHIASYYGQFEVVRLLLDHGTEANVETNTGESPLHKVSCGKYESQEDGVRVARLLLDRGMDVNRRRNDQCTPLHVASYCGKLGVVRLLLERGARVDVEANTGATPLHSVSWGEYESQEYGVHIARLLLEHGADPNARHKEKWTPLHAASYYGMPEIARLLLDHGSDANAETDNGDSPLHKASCGKFKSQEDGVRVARVLLERGVDANRKRNDQCTPLHVASYCGKVEIVRLLLERGAKMDAKASTGATPLHSVSWGEFDSLEDGVRVARLLLEHGADANVQRNDKWTPLHAAAYYGKPELAQLLLDHGSEANAETDNGETPLHKVTCGKYKSPEDGVRIAQLFLERGVDVNQKRNDQCTPLHVASYCGKVEVIRLLLERGARVDAKAGTGATPLHSVTWGDYESQEDGARIARLLLEHGANVDAQRNDKWTPLHAASSHGKFQIVQVLLERGAEADAEADNGETPLHSVACGKYKSQEDGVRVAQLLLERGADVNRKRNDQCTPLHVASYCGKLEIVRLLLERGAKADAEAGTGAIPLHSVSWGEYESREDGVQVARLLLERGVDVNARSKDKWTPLHAASYHGKPEIVQLLLDHGADENAEVDNGDSPLHKVSCGKYKSQEAGVRIVQLFLERGMDVNRKRNDQCTPLHVASYCGKVEIVRLLLERGAKVDVEASTGAIPLHSVSWGEYESQEDGVHVARLLLEHDSDVNARGKDKWTPLHAASYYGKPEIVRLLLDRSAEANSEADNGDTPLHLVSRGKHEPPEDGVRVARLLLERGADVNKQRHNDQCTALHSASYWGKIDVVQVLLEHGARTNVEASTGATPLHSVSWGEHGSQEDGVRIGQLLLEHGADVNAKAKSGQTPIDSATRNQRFKLAQLLLENAVIFHAQRPRAS